MSEKRELSELEALDCVLEDVRAQLDISIGAEKVRELYEGGRIEVGDPQHEGAKIEIKLNREGLAKLTRCWNLGHDVQGIEDPHVEDFQTWAIQGFDQLCLTCEDRHHVLSVTYAKPRYG